MRGLMAGERVVHWSGPHPVVYVRSALLAAAGLIIAAFLTRVLPGWVSGAVAGATLLMVAPEVVRHLSCRCGVTNKRVRVQTGWIAHRSMEAALTRVGAVTVSQSLLGRFLDYGDVSMALPGGKAEELRRLRSPQEFRNRILEQLIGR